MQNLTDITVLLDRTGSMESIANDTIGGLNEFIKKQKELGDNATFSLIQFDSVNPYEILELAKPISKVNLIDRKNYQPRGATPLIDSLAKTIDCLGNRLKEIPEQQRPDKVIVVVITDGEENASREFSLEAVKNKIQHQQDVYKWNFIFLGAGIDAIKAGGSVGISTNCTATVARQNIYQAFATTADKITRYRASSNISNLEYTDDERAQLSTYIDPTAKH